MILVLIFAIIMTLCHWKFHNLVFYSYLLPTLHQNKHSLLMATHASLCFPLPPLLMWLPFSHYVLIWKWLPLLVCGSIPLADYFWFYQAVYKRSTVPVFKAHGLAQASISDCVTETFSAIRTVSS